jgi:hypothetical protein
MMRRLLAAAALSIAVVGLSPVPASAAATVLTVESIVVNSNGVAAQSIHIDGDTNQSVTVEFPGGAPRFYEEPIRSGQQPCAKETAIRYVCGGTSDSVYISYRTPLDMEVSRSFTVVATAEDGTRATGTVSVQVLADVSVVKNFTVWRTSDSSSTSTPAKLMVAEQNLGPALAHDLVVRVTGLDTSLGLPSGCQALGSGVVECVRPNLPISLELVVRSSLEFTIPYCQVHRSVTITIEPTTQTDPQPANNTYVIAAIPTYGSTICSGGSGGGSQGGAGGTAGTTSPANPADSSTVDAVATPSATSDAPLATATDGGEIPVALRRDTGRDLTWLGIFIAGALALGVGALGGWWWRRRTAALPNT